MFVRDGFPGRYTRHPSPIPSFTPTPDPSRRDHASTTEVKGSGTKRRHGTRRSSPNKHLSHPHRQQTHKKEDGNREGEGEESLIILDVPSTGRTQGRRLSHLPVLSRGSSTGVGTDSRSGGPGGAPRRRCPTDTPSKETYEKGNDTYGDPVLIYREPRSGIPKATGPILHNVRDGAPAA